MTANVNDDIMYMIFSILLDFPKEPEHVDHPILALALLRCDPYAYPTDTERKTQRSILRQVCKRWRAAIKAEIEAKPVCSLHAGTDLDQLLRDDPIKVTLRICLEHLSLYTMERLSAEAPSVRHLMIAPLVDQYRPENLVMKMSRLTTLSINFNIDGLPFEQWELPSLRTFGLQYDDVEPEDLRSLLCNVGRTITTLSCDVIHHSFDHNEPGGVNDDVWLWCPFLTNLRTYAVTFSQLQAPPPERPPVTIFLIDFDLALTAPPYHYGFSTFFERGQTVSFGTTWSTFFSSMELVDSCVFSDFMLTLMMEGYRVVDREGVLIEEVDTDTRFTRAREVYGCKTYRKDVQ